MKRHIIMGFCLCSLYYSFPSTIQPNSFTYHELLPGDQLESINIKRQRAAQARDMMILFDTFNAPPDENPDLGDLLQDPAAIHNVCGPNGLALCYYCDFRSGLRPNFFG